VKQQDGDKKEVKHKKPFFILVTLSPFACFLQITQYGRKVVWPAWNLQTEKDVSHLDRGVHCHHQDANLVSNPDLTNLT
jgi:hypothetical protein